MSDKLGSDETWISGQPARGGIKVAVAYPNSYWVGSSNLGYQTILRTFLETPGFDVRRVFWEGNRLHFPDGGRSLAEFEIVAISVSYQPDMIHLPRMLETGTPVAGLHRHRPLIMGGGVALSINPETSGSYFDVIVLGDSEPVMPGILETLRDYKGSREDLLAEFSETRGLYVPSFYSGEVTEGSSLMTPVPSGSAPSRVTRAFLSTLDDSPARPAYLTTNTEFGSLYLMEISRGCGAGCSFCAAGSICGPVRFLGMDGFKKELELGLEFRDRIGLVGTAVSYHPQLTEIAREIHSMGGVFSPSSVRLERITSEFAELLAESGHKTVSIAPEAGSESIRKAIGKGVSSDAILGKIGLLQESGIPNIKLYFMVGLPGEEDADVREIVDLATAVRDRVVKEGRKKGRVGTVSVSLNPFVPKPGTTLEREPMCAENVLTRRMKMVRDGLGPVGGVKVQSGSIRRAYIDGLLSLGDRRISTTLDKLPEKGVSLKRLIKIAPEAERILFDRASGSLPWEFIK